MNKPHLKLRAYLVLSALAIILSAINLYLAKTWDVFGSPALFAMAILLQLILALTFIHSLVVILWKPLQIVGSILVSAWDGIQKNSYIRTILRSKSPVVSWLRRRFDIASPTGPGLTVAIAIALAWLMGFAGITRQVLLKEVLTRIDTRVINLVPSTRPSAQTSFFSIITFLANWQTMIVLTALFGWVLWRCGQKYLAALLPAVFVAEELIATLLKHLVGRTRPENYLSLIHESSASFPSGHALRATLLYGLLAYFLYKSLQSTLARLVIAATYLTVVFLVGLSRIYLGVHYPSDVLASVLFGGFLLTIIIACLELSARYQLWGQRTAIVPARKLLFVPLAIAVFSIILAPIFIRPTVSLATPGYRMLAALNEQTTSQLPLYSETLTGAHMEPIGFIYVGYEDQIKQRYEQAGWTKADPSTLFNTLRAVAVGFQGGQYLSAPVTPSYLLAKPQDLAFEKPTASNTLRQRHHTRIWRTDFALPDGRPIWVATASFDEGIEFAGPARLPTHHIDPNVDAERSYIAGSLGAQDSEFLQVVAPELGQNASGDRFFTDGRAVVVRL